MRYLKELREGDMLSETYLCKSKQVLQTGGKELLFFNFTG